MTDLVASLIDDYRRSVERREALAYRDKRDAIADARYERAQQLQMEQNDRAWFSEQRAQETHQAWQEEKARGDQQRELWGQLFEGMNVGDGEARVVNLGDELGQFNKSRNNSGTGKNIVFVGDKGDVGIGLQTADGKMLPLTVDPEDNSSPELFIAKEDRERIMPFLHNAIAMFKQDNPNATPADLLAKMQSVLVPDDLGRLRPADEEEFQENLKRLGIATQPVAEGVPEESYSEKFEKDGAVGVVGKAASEVGNNLTKPPTSLLGSVASAALQKPIQAVKDAASDAYQGAKEFLVGKPSAEEEQETKAEKNKKAVHDFFSAEGRAKVSKLREVEDLNAIFKIGEKEREEGKQQEPTEGQKKRYEQIAGNEIANVEWPVARRKKWAMEAARAGIANKEMLMNFVETGDIRFNRFQLEQMDLNTKKAFMQYKKAEAKVYGSKEVGPKEWDAFTKILDHDFKGLAAVHFPGSKDSSRRDAFAYNMRMAALESMHQLNINPQNYGNPEFRLAFNKAAQYLSNYDGDISASSLTPFLKTIQHGINPKGGEYDDVVESMLGLAESTGMNNEAVGLAIDAAIGEFMAVHQTGELDEETTAQLIHYLGQNPDKAVEYFRRAHQQSR